MSAGCICTLGARSPSVYPSSVVLVVASLPSYISALSGEQTEQARPPRMACPCFIVFVQMHRKKCRHSENSSKGLLMKSPMHRTHSRPEFQSRLWIRRFVILGLGLEFILGLIYIITNFLYTHWIQLFWASSADRVEQTSGERGSL